MSNRRLSLILPVIGVRLFLILCLCLLTGIASAQMRIKDLVDFEGVRDNQLIGYGLVVGLDGSGDRLRNAPFTERSIEGMLERLGVQVTDQDLDTRNVAAVMVTATLPPFARQGSRIDVAVSALGDSDSLLGGTLLVTPLMGADGEVYAVAQGAVIVSGFSVEGDAQSVTRGVPTAGQIPNGAIVEREVAFALSEMRQLHLTLRNPDFTTAVRIAEAVNQRMRVGPTPVATATDPATVRLELPVTANGGEVAAFIAGIENLIVQPDQLARVIVDEGSGTIVIGESVRVSTVAIAQGNLTVRVTETPQVSQPQPFAEEGETVVVPRTEIEIDDGEENRLALIDGSVSLESLVNGLNTLGVGPRDIVSILRAIKAAGALHAELEVL